MVEDLNARVGEKIAEVTGAEAGYVTCGSFAAMTLAAAACIAGVDPVRIRQLPDTTGLPNEIVIHRAHRLNYDQAYRVAGAKLVEIGVPYGTEPWELERAITGQTVAVAYHDSPNTGPGALDFAIVVELAHSRNVPVIEGLLNSRRWTSLVAKRVGGVVVTFAVAPAAVFTPRRATG